ncbi:MAG: HAMP domain-containing protein [Clostridiales bacterium]|nr:HAMP domain-containing protein [Clostridiales bacterium]
MFKNIKLKNKFLIMILTTVLLVGFIGMFSTDGLHQSKKAIKSELSINKTNVEKSMNSIKNIIQLRFITFKVNKNLNPNYTPAQYEEARKTVNDAYINARKPLEIALENLDPKTSSDLLVIIEDCVNKVDNFYNEFMLLLNYHEQGKYEYVTQTDQRAAKLGDELFEAAYNIPNVNFSQMVSNLDVTLNAMTTRTLTLIILTIICILFSLIFGINLSNTIRKPIEKLKDAAYRVLKGDLDLDIRTNNRDEIGELSNSIANMSDTIQYIIDDINNLSEKLEEGNTSYRINIDKYDGAFKNATEAINIATNDLVKDNLYVANIIKEIEQGIFNNEIKELPGDKAISTQALKNIQLTLRAISKEINGLINAAINGDLEYKICNKNYSGEWKATIDGLNTFVEGIVSPIKETQNAIYQFSLGNFEHRITNEYKGEFDKIKQTVNYTADTIDSYISEITNILNEMAHKNFDVSIDREYLGDFKAIQKSVNLIVNNLNSLTKDIISSAEKVSDGSRKISKSSISLAEGAAQQSESVGKLNKIIKLISKQTLENAKNSNKANILAIQTRENASKGSEQMNDMLIAMEAINTASSSISNIIKVIDDIAFQTNILALNAAVEAARAGEHGKGFAVVAEEVRSLASRSQQAARETTELIQSSVLKVEEGSKMANQTSEALLSIVRQIEDIYSLIESCANASNEQEKSISQIMEGIEQISNVTQVNTSTSEESAAASEELASQAEIFYASVSDFKLKNSNNSLNIKVSKDIVTKKQKKDEKHKGNNIDLNSNDMIILDDNSDIIIDENLDFGKY